MRNNRLLVFDLDSTLAPVDGSIDASTVQLLRQLEQQGNIIAVCSGKPVVYLCGVMRQVGLDAPILLGENGMYAQFGVHYPPMQHHRLPIADESIHTIDYIRSNIYALLPDVWCQPNLLMYTPYPTTTEQWDTIDRLIADNSHIHEWVDVYKHFDCYDFVPRGVSKGVGVEWLAGRLQIDMDNSVAVGDGINDYSMFAVAGLAVGINVADASRVNINFGCINDALQYLLDMH